MPALGTPELLILFLIILLLFGASRLPKMARSLGEAGRELRRARGDDDLQADAADHGSAR